MSEITLTIDGKEVKGQEGDTILNVCQKNDIHIPTLCYHKELSIVGACRLCIVEVEGSRRLNSSCTTPATDGMVVHTQTQKIRDYRRMILELVFSERNHFCPACVMNGDCDLQSMGYELGMDHVRYEYLFPKYGMDNTHSYIGMDPHRCILCTRCIRACDEITGVHTLDLKERGWQAQIEVDLRGELGDSTCISCGACVQVCPTGALFEKLGAYRSNRKDRTLAKTVCTTCSVNCGVEVSVKDEQAVNIDGDYESPVNKGLLCVKGRFQTLENARARLNAPVVDGKRTTWDQALSTVSERLNAIKTSRGSDAIAAVASPAASNESLYTFKRFVQSAIGTSKLDTLYSQDLKVTRSAVKELLQTDETPTVEATLEDVQMADCIVLVGATPEESHEIIAATLRRGTMARRIRLIVINTRTSELERVADVRLRPIKRTDGILINGLMNAILEGGWTTTDDSELAESLAKYTPEFVEEHTAIRSEELAKAAQIYATAQRPVIVYGRGITKSNDPGVLVSLMNLAILTGNVEAEKIRVLGLRKGGNAQGAADLGVFSDFELADLDPTQVRALYLMTADMPVEWSEELLEQLQQLEFLVVQGNYPGPLAEIADVLLPATVWAEREGSATNMDHRLQSFEPVVSRSPVLANNGSHFRDDWDVLATLAKQMGQDLELDSVAAIRSAITKEHPHYRTDSDIVDVRTTAEPDLTSTAPRYVDYASR